MDGSPADRPVLLLMKGHPGSGKSTVALEIARRCRWPLIDKDDARDALATAPLANWQQALSEAATKALNETSYDIMFRVTARQLQCGLSTVVDCPLARPQVYDLAKALAAQARFSQQTYVCEAHLSVLKHRSVWCAHSMKQTWPWSSASLQTLKCGATAWRPEGAL